MLMPGSIAEPAAPPSPPLPPPGAGQALLGIHSPWRSPAFNIALEESLRAVVAATASGFFVCSRNDPAIIVGRNQNTAAEITSHARARGVPVFRRTTGGGAVYHDAGNLNWSFIVRGSLEDRPRLLARVRAVLEALGIPAAEGPRSGLYAGGRKIGGTACAAGRGVLLFHGTLLVSTDLAELRATLAAHGPAYAAADAARGGVASVPSELATLAELRPGIDVAAVETALLGALGRAGRAASPAAAVDLAACERLAGEFARESWVRDRKPPSRKRRETA